MELHKMDLLLNESDLPDQVFMNTQGFFRTIK